MFESLAPPLANYDEFKEFMAARDIRAVREYIPPGIDEETGKEVGDFWTVVIMKEKPLPDGQIYMQFLYIGERHVLEGWREAWEHEAQLLAQILEHKYEDVLGEHQVV